MKILPLQEFLDNQKFFISEAKEGKIFVYPTDTVYGIGGIYTPQVIDKIFAIKKRDEKKLFSLIAPSFDRIEKNYMSTPITEEMRRLSGDKEIPLSKSPNPQKNPQIPSILQLKEYLSTYHGVTYIFDHQKPGIRIIKHPFQTFVEMLGEPFITTSCNISGEAVITDIKDLPSEIADKVEYIIDGGILGGKPSVLIDLVENKIIER